MQHTRQLIMRTTDIDPTLEMLARPAWRHVFKVAAATVGTPSIWGSDTDTPECQALRLACQAKPLAQLLRDRKLKRVMEEQRQRGIEEQENEAIKQFSAKITQLSEQALTALMLNLQLVLGRAQSAGAVPRARTSDAATKRVVMQSCCYVALLAKRAADERIRSRRLGGWDPHSVTVARTLALVFTPSPLHPYRLTFT